MALNKVPISELSNNVRDTIEVKASIVTTTYNTGSKIYSASTITGDLDLTDIQDQKLWVKFGEVNDVSEVKFSFNGKSSVPIVDINGLPLAINKLITDVVYDCNYSASDGILYVNTQLMQGQNSLIYESIPPIPSGANDIYTYEDFFNHFVLYGQCTVLPNSGFVFPLYYRYATYGARTATPVILNYCSLKWEVLRDKNAVILEMYFPEINETYITTRTGLQPVATDADCPATLDSTTVLVSDWERVVNEVAYSMYAETKLFLNFIGESTNNAKTQIRISRTDGQPFSPGMNLSYRGMGGFNNDYVNSGSGITGGENVSFKAFINNVDTSRSAQKGYAVECGKEGETNSNYKFINRSMLQSGRTYLDLSLGQNDFHFTSGELFVHANSSGLGSIAHYGDAEIINKSTGDSKIEKGIFGMTTSNIVCTPGNTVKEIVFEHSAFSDGTIANAFLYVDIRSCDYRDVKLLKVEYL